MTEPLRDKLIRSVDMLVQLIEEHYAEQDVPNQPTDEDLLTLLRDHPLRTNIVRAAKEMAEYHNDAGRGARQVGMLVNTVDYARLVLKVYGHHDP